MKRLNNESKKQLGTLIHYYRNSLFHSNSKDAQLYKQINFCKDVCSQAQLSRLEHGEILKDNQVYEIFLEKLNLDLEKVSGNDYSIFQTYFENILIYQNDDNLIINYNQYVLMINKFQNIFKKNIIYTHYNYAVEFILAILNKDLEDARYLIDDIENNLDILPPIYLVLTLQYLGSFYVLTYNFERANKYYLLAIENMVKFEIDNPVIYIDIAHNYIKMNHCLNGFIYLNKALNHFDNTYNDLILTKIYQHLSLIYLKKKRFEESIHHINKSLDYIIKANNTNLQHDINLIKVIIYYSMRDYETALKLLKNIKHNHKSLFIKKAIAPEEDIDLDIEEYSTISKLYIHDNKEEWFEENIEKILTKFDEEINIMIIFDMYDYYKDNKKYKKAIDLKEKFNL